jgi:hypothetical protein
LSDARRTPAFSHFCPRAPKKLCRLRVSSGNHVVGTPRIPAAAIEAWKPAVEKEAAFAWALHARLQLSPISHECPNSAWDQRANRQYPFIGPTTQGRNAVPARPAINTYAERAGGWDLPDTIGDRSRGQILQIPARKRRFSMTNVTLTASECHDHIGEAFDRSLNQPVVIPKHGRPRNVVLSYGEYRRLAARDRPRRG